MKKDFLLFQQQLRRTDPVYASMTSHNVSNSNPSPPPADQRQTPPPDTVIATKCYSPVLLKITDIIPNIR